ncbi:hypothetical protein AQUSIP_07610 [Aquicella siphonis]|uniref:Uncharacterized protein n=1 Tax=Aquicella siphonis TaxID=254247 RepID=A0A5E4PGM5_9COXI|nr:hypothetical protein [Aquicella siphonis]VVC75471.1 hypothetical protein AQUSIP_07610 [Aquicella siphonis]
MKIRIKITPEQAGTELGELCDPTYHYECRECDKTTAALDYPADGEAVIELTVEEISPSLKNAFFISLNNYLNKKFERDMPGQWDNETYQEVVNRIRMQTIARSPHFSIGAVMGLFAPPLLSDPASLIRRDLSNRDCLHSASTSTTARIIAINNTFGKSV